VQSAPSQPITQVVWFERRGDRIGYRVTEELQNGAVLEAPRLNGTLERLYGDLEEMLVARGLYREEAHAMIQTWRDSWFEEGSRLFYIVPDPFVNDVLPLTITPAPTETVRVFVGRLELISAATQKAVALSMACGDKATLAKYGRFLEPILASIKTLDATTQTETPPSRNEHCRRDSQVVAVRH
jgi:hypothetical protein